MQSIQSLGDQFKSSIIDLLVTMTIFRDEFDGRFLVLAIILLFLQCFHWALRLRVDYVEQTTQFARLDLWRLAILASLLLTADILFVCFALDSVLENGIGVVVLFGFESTLLACAVIQSSLRLVYNVYDMKTGYQWRAKGVFVLWTHFVAECFNVLVYLIFFGVVLFYIGRPLHLIRQMYHTFRRFHDFAHDISVWRRATHNFDERYPNVTQAELLEQNTDDVCIICREQIEVGKRLPCGHVLHAECLQDWLRRKQICPTCRLSVLREQIHDSSKLWKPPRDRAAAAAAGAAAGPAHVAPPAVDGDNNEMHDGDDDNDDRPPAPLRRNHVDDDDDDDNNDNDAQPQRGDEDSPRVHARRGRSSRRKKDVRAAVSILLEAASDAAVDSPESRQLAIKRAQKAIQLLADNGGEQVERNLQADQWRQVDQVMDETTKRLAEMMSAMRRMQSQFTKDHKRLTRSIVGERPQPDAGAAAEELDALVAQAMLESMKDAPIPKAPATAAATTVATAASSSSSSSSSSTTTAAPAATTPKYSLPDALTSPPATPVAPPTTSSRSPLTASTPNDSSLAMSGIYSNELSTSTNSMTTPSELEEMRQKRLARLGSLQFSSRAASSGDGGNNDEEQPKQQD
jgi:E3 ubiquitin-protein ligase synoviolin